MMARWHGLSIFRDVLAIDAGFLVVDIDVIDFPAGLALVFIIDLHDFDLFLTILD